MTGTIARSRKELKKLDRDLCRVLDLIPEFDPWMQMQPGMYFDLEAAYFALDWIPDWLKFHKGPKAGQPFELDAWQQAIVGCVWGFRDADGSRRFNTVFLYVGKKNGKSAFTAALICLFMATEGSRGMELYSLASSQKQASNVFKHVAGMVEQQEAFVGRWRILGNRGGTVAKSVTDDSTQSSYRVLCSDAGTVDGLEPDMAVIDELHRHKTGELMDVTRRSARNNPNHLILITTTADYNRESACNDELKRARLIRTNQNNPGQPGFAPNYFPAVWEADKAQAEEIDKDGVAGWQKPEVWAQANPGLGTIKPYAALEEGVREVLDQPSLLNDFLRLDLNIVTDTAQAFLDPTQWDDCEPGLVDLAPVVAHLDELWDELEGEPCYMGIDLSRKTDQTAVALWFPDHGVVLVWHWIPQDRATYTEKAHGIPYSAWARHGLITICPGGIVDFDLVEAKLVELVEHFDVQGAGFDPYKFERIRQDIVRADVDVELTSMTQGAKTLGEATIELEALVVAGELKHGGHPVLRQNARNVTVRTDANKNIVPCKKSSTGPIDGVLALVMALAGAILEVAGPSLDDIYSEEEPLDA